MLSKTKAFKIAEKSGLSVEQQVELLALQDEEDRVKYLLAHLAALSKSLAEREVLLELLRNDGYLNPASP